MSCYALFKASEMPWMHSRRGRLIYFSFNNNSIDLFQLVSIRPVSEGTMQFLGFSNSVVDSIMSIACIFHSF